MDERFDSSFGQVKFLIQKKTLILLDTVPLHIQIEFTAIRFQQWDLIPSYISLQTHVFILIQRLQYPSEALQF